MAQLRHTSHYVNIQFDLCVYHLVHTKNTLYSAYAMPRVEDVIESVSTVKFISKLYYKSVVGNVMFIMLKMLNSWA